jgi:choline kinase
VKAIVLAAGLGTRLKPITESMPKCLTMVNQTPILANALNCLGKSPVTEVIIVVGYQAKEIKRFAGLRWGNLAIRYVENSHYRNNNTAASLSLALETLGTLKEPLLIIEADVFFEQAVIDGLINDGRENVTLVQKYNSSLDGSFVDINSECHVIEWWHISQRPSDFVKEDKFKTVNLHRFSPSFVNAYLIPAIRETLRCYGEKAPFEYVMRKIVTKKQDLIFARNVDNGKWCEIDDASDLERAESIFKTGKKKGDK